MRLSGWPATIGLIAVAAIFGALAYRAIDKDRPVTITLGDHTITIGGGQKFEDVLEKALLTDIVGTEDILDEYGYYHVGGDELLRTLAAFDVPDFRKFTDPPGLTEAELRRDDLRGGLLAMVGDLDGPFETPGTLRAATEKFKNAMTDLENAMADMQEASPLLVWLWEKSIDREELFRKRVFRADVRRASGRSDEENIVVAGCAGNPFKDRMIQMFTPDLSGAISAPLTVDIGRMRCDEPDPALPRMLKGDAAVQIAINAGAAKAIFGPEGFEAPAAKALFEHDDQFEWTFEVLPKDLSPRIQLTSN